MEFLLSFLLLAFNLVNYEVGLNKYAFLAVSAVLMVFLFIVVYRKTKDTLVTCMILMCHTWQISWVNIFGEPTANMQLPWFYIIGAVIVLYAVFNFRKCLKKNYGVAAFMFFVVCLVMFNYPLVIANSMSNAVKEYIMIGFFVLVLFACFLFKDTVSKENYERFKSSMIWAVFLSSFAIVMQYILFTYANISLFKIVVIGSFSGYQTNCYLLMEDHSCSTIMLGCVIFYILERIDKKRWAYMVPALLIVIISMAVTSRRTSTLSLIIILAVYVLFHYKGIGKKLLFSLLGGIVVFVMLYYLLIARPVDSLAQIINDNGRIENYISALKVIKEHPFGVGYDDMHLVSYMDDGITPHNTFLRWCVMGGIHLGVLLVGIICFALIDAGRKKVTAEYWAILYTMFASNFIPDVLNARFFVILCSVAFLVKGQESVSAEPEPSAAVSTGVISGRRDGSRRRVGQTALERKNGYRETKTGRA